jgi:hypothetical protein
MLLKGLRYSNSRSIPVSCRRSFSPRMPPFSPSASWDGVVRRIDLKYGDRTRFAVFASQTYRLLPNELLKHIFSFVL